MHRSEGRHALEGVAGRVGQHLAGSREVSGVEPVPARVGGHEDRRARVGVAASEWGPNLELLGDVCARTDKPVVASGGVSTLDDLRAIACILDVPADHAPHRLDSLGLRFGRK